MPLALALAAVLAAVPVGVLLTTGGSSPAQHEPRPGLWPTQLDPSTLPPGLEPSERACTRRERPTEDLNGLVARLGAGDVVCLAPGDYGARGGRTDWRASGTRDKPLLVRADRRGTVRLLGFVNLMGSHVVLDRLVFAGPTGSVHPANWPDGEEVLLWIQGDDNTLRRCEVRDGRWHAGVYITGRRSTVEACWVHDIGPWDDREQRQAGGRADNIDHGIYWGKGSSGALVNSVIEHNLAYGVQITKGVRGVVVANNTIVRNGAGGVIWAERTSDSALVNNIIAFNNGFALDTYLLKGSNNVAERNLGWRNTRGEWNDSGAVVMRHNVVGDPRFRAARDYRLGAGSAAVDAGRWNGVPFEDFDGRLRPQGDGLDIGAHEQSVPGADPDFRGLLHGRSPGLSHGLSRGLRYLAVRSRLVSAMGEG